MREIVLSFFFFLPSVSFISFMMYFSLGIRGHEYTKYPWWNVSGKHGVNPVNHEWLLSLLCCVCEWCWKWGTTQWHCSHQRTRRQCTYLRSVITRRRRNTYSQDISRMWNHDTIMFCLSHLDVQKEVTLNHRGVKNMNTLFREEQIQTACGFLN